MLFPETAEELVNRLCREWLNDKDFPADLVNNPISQMMMVTALENFDECVDEQTTIPLELLTTMREKDVLRTFAQGLCSKLKRSSSPPKPTHRKRHQKVNYLKVVNG